MCRICTNAIIHSKNENSVIIYLPSCCSQMYMLFIVIYVTCVLISKSCESLCNRPFNGNLICPSAHLNRGDSFTYDKHLHLICIHVQIKMIHDN